MRREVPQAQSALKPLDLNARTGNVLRPVTFDQMVGQSRLKPLLRRIVASASQSGRPLPHMLMVGAAGTGKTTIAQVVAHESGRRVFQFTAPIGLDILDGLRTAARAGDVVIIDEIHMLSSGDRRGLTSSADVESLYAAMEDRRFVTPTSVLPFPAVTFIGATTDAGLLPAPLLARFPLQPQLDPYTADDMAALAVQNAADLGLPIDAVAAAIFGRAARATPRQVNTYVKQAEAIGATMIDGECAREVVVDLSSTTLDGLTRPMAGMLTFLLGCPRISRGELVYRASVNSIATALGFSRDTKHIALFVEPELLKRGLVNVTSGGRQLSDAGIRRAKELV
jgi:Holliday junction DNA helicase RuvB